MSTMTPEHTLRLECLKLAMDGGWRSSIGTPIIYGGSVSLAPTVDEVLDAAGKFYAFAAGTTKAPPEPVEPGSMAEAIEALRREVPGMVRDAMGAAYDP